MSIVFHRFKYVVLILGDLAGLAAAATLAVGVASAAPSMRPPVGLHRWPAAAHRASAIGDFSRGGRLGRGLSPLFIALLQSDQYGIEAAELSGPDTAYGLVNELTVPRRPA